MWERQETPFWKNDPTSIQHPEKKGKKYLPGAAFPGTQTGILLGHGSTSQPALVYTTEKKRGENLDSYTVNFLSKNY